MEGRPSLFQASSSGWGLSRSVQGHLASQPQNEASAVSLTFKKSEGVKDPRFQEERPEAKMHTARDAQDHGLRGGTWFNIPAPSPFLGPSLPPQGPTSPSSLANTLSAPGAHLCFPSQYPTVTITFSLEPSFPIHARLPVFLTQRRTHFKQPSRQQVPKK